MSEHILSKFGGPSLGRTVPAFRFCQQNDTSTGVVSDEVNSRVLSLHKLSPTIIISDQRALFLPQGGHRVNSGGPASRNPSCDESDCQQREERESRCLRVQGLKPEERRFQNGSDGIGARETDENPCANHPKRIAQHHPNHIAGSST
jgi:hypothetical protein